MSRLSEDIKKDVVDQLYWDDRINASKVNIDVSEDGKVSLNGTVPHYRARDAAEQDAWSVAGVSSVENNLSVEFPETFTVPTDEDIKSNVETSLLLNDDIDSSEIDVSVVGGVVTLEGEIDAYWKKIKAENLTSETSGVISVRNKLSIVPTESVVDESIADSITSSIDRSFEVSVDDVTVKVKNGVVTLLGTVPDWNAYDAAMDAARYTAGVTDIKDELIIES